VFLVYDKPFLLFALFSLASIRLASSFIKSPLYARIRHAHASIHLASSFMKPLPSQ
tara:strand:- start:1558 stop:1725 length:168 start_codon:yes stop_codon:yes gene_type:complete